MICCVEYHVLEDGVRRAYCGTLEAADWQEALDRAVEVGARVAGALGLVIAAHTGETVIEHPEPPACPACLRDHPGHAHHPKEHP